MYPAAVKYESPRSVEEAIKLLSAGDGEAKVLAGGQSLVPMLKLRFASPQMLVDINNIPGLRYHKVESDGSIRIGALCRHEDLEKSDVIKKSQPTLAAAAHLVADPIVRTRGTFVGSVCHADPQGDWAATMIALDGYIVAQGPKGKRNISMNEFVVGPFENALRVDELAVEAVIPAPKGKAFGGYLKLERRVGDFATASVAVGLDISSNGTVQRAGIALAGVGGETINAKDASGALVGKKLSPELIAQVAKLTSAAANPKSDHRGSSDYKRHIVEVFVTRILTNIQSQQTKAA
jgi:carbon-monoxide dehydrogenase medium subunit